LHKRHAGRRNRPSNGNGVLVELVIEIAGWFAAGVLLAAYGMLSKGRLSGQGWSFQSLNVVGSLLVGLNSLAHEAWPSVSVNVVWLVIGVATLVATRRSRPDDAATDAVPGPDAAPDTATAAAAYPDPAPGPHDASPTVGSGPAVRGDTDQAPPACTAISTTATALPARTDMHAVVVGSCEGVTGGRAAQPTLV
jgi:hypothetical protein